MWGCARVQDEHKDVSSAIAVMASLSVGHTHNTTSMVPGPSEIQLENTSRRKLTLPQKAGRFPCKGVLFISILNVISLRSHREGMVEQRFEPRSF